MTATTPATTSGRLLVTGVGGASGLAVAQHARWRDPCTWWADADPGVPALLLYPDRTTTVPLAADPGFGPELIARCRELDVVALSPNVDVEITATAAASELFEAAGVRTWVPDPATIGVCVDKIAFADFVASETELPTPQTWASVDELPTRAPAAGYVVKPRVGSGAQGVHLCADRTQVDAALTLTPDALIQERILGQEFSADALSLPGKKSLVHLRTRVKVKAGMSVVAESIVHEPVARAISRLLAALDYTGPSCVQGFLTDTGFVLTEVNVRFGGGCALAQHSGGRLLDRYLHFLHTGHYDTDSFGYAPGHQLIRTFEGVTIDRKDS